MSVQSVNMNAVDSASASWWISTGRSRESQPAAVASPLAAKAEVSALAQMLAKLDSLVKSDPMKFADVTSQIAAQLAAAARDAPGSDANVFSRLAERFAAASTSGDVSLLAPPQPPQRGYDQPNGITMNATDVAGGSSPAVRRVMDEVFAAIGAL